MTPKILVALSYGEPQYNRILESTRHTMLHDCAMVDPVWKLRRNTEQWFGGK
jgi:hypothetical protein